MGQFNEEAQGPPAQKRFRQDQTDFVGAAGNLSTMKSDVTAKDILSDQPAQFAIRKKGRA